MRKRILVLGDEAVGKTSLIARAVGQDLDELLSKPLIREYEISLSEIGLSTEKSKKSSSKSGVDQQALEEISLCFYDTSGMDEHSSVPKHLFQQADLFVLCYSIISPASFANARNKWYQAIEDYRGKEGSGVVVAATKRDLREDEEVIRRLSERNLTPVSRSSGKDLARFIASQSSVSSSAASSESAFVEVSSADPSSNLLFLRAVASALGVSKKQKSNGGRFRCDIA